MRDKADLPYPIIVGNDAGAGTPNAIQVSTAIPVSASSMVRFTVAETNTADGVSVSFNGGPVLTIKTNSGNDISPGGILAGMVVFGAVSGSTFRMQNDQSSAAIVAAVEAAKDVATAAAAEAVSLVGLAATAVQPSDVETSVYTPPEGLASPRTIRAKLADNWGLLDFGIPAAGNDVTALWMNVCAAEDVLKIEIPAGVHSLEDSASIVDRPISIEGRGSEASVIMQRTAGKRAVDFRSTSLYSRYNGLEYQTCSLKMRGVAIVSGSNNAEAGIYAEWVDRVDDTSFFSANDVKVMPDDFSHYFGNLIHLKNCNGTRMDNVQLVGESSKRGSTAVRPYSTDIGIFWDCGNAYPKVSHYMNRVTARDINTAFKAVGSAEGFYFYGCDPALVSDCYDFDLFGIEEGGVNSPNLHVLGGHCNFRRSGVRLKDMYNIFLQNVDFLHDGEAGASIDSDIIYATNAPFLKVMGCEFSNKGSLHTGVVRGLYGIDNCAYYQVIGNSFNGIKTEHVNLGGTAGQLIARDNINLGGTGYVGYRTGANITGSVKNNDFFGTFSYQVDAANAGLLVGNNETHP